MLKRLSFVLLITATLALTSCATGYVKPNFLSNLGYQETKVSENVYLVEFLGNSATPLETTYQYALRHAAELAKSNGYGHFNVLLKDSFYVPGDMAEPKTVIKVQFVSSGTYDVKSILAKKVRQ